MIRTDKEKRKELLGTVEALREGIEEGGELEGGFLQIVADKIRKNVEENAGDIDDYLPELNIELVRIVTELVGDIGDREELGADFIENVANRIGEAVIKGDIFSGAD